MLDASTAKDLFNRLRAVQELIDSPLLRAVPSVPYCLRFLMDLGASPTEITSQTLIHPGATATLAAGPGYAHRVFTIAGTLAIKRDSLETIVLNGAPGSCLQFDAKLASSSDLLGFSQVVLADNTELRLNHRLEANVLIIEKGARLILGPQAQVKSAQLMLSGTLEGPSEYRWHDVDWDRAQAFLDRWKPYLDDSGCYIVDSELALRIQNLPVLDRAFYQKFLQFTEHQSRRKAKR